MITMRALIERAERHFPANPAIVPAAAGQDGPVTWSEFAVRVRRAAGALRSLGVGEGDRFAILCRNDPRQAELIHAGYWMGAVAVPINYRLAPREIAEILDGAAPRLLAVEDHLAGLASDPMLARGGSCGCGLARTAGVIPTPSTKRSVTPLRRTRAGSASKATMRCCSIPEGPPAAPRGSGSPTGTSPRTGSSSWGRMALSRTT